MMDPQVAFPADGNQVIHSFITAKPFICTVVNIQVSAAAAALTAVVIDFHTLETLSLPDRTSGDVFLVLSTYGHVFNCTRFRILAPFLFDD